MEPEEVIAQTRQVNDLNSLENRQASYTNKFKLPKTGRNLKIFNFLSVTGNTSGIPYQKNECSLYSETGECFVYKGRAVITDGGTHFEVVVYDGIIDLYKAIENKNLSSLGLESLTHGKTVPVVAASWAGTTPYRYILADYNGDTGTVNHPTPQVNIDYLTPSVNVAWLWDKIFSEHAMEYEGSVFDTEAFKNLWMTYPKGQTSAGENNTTVFESAQYEFRSWNAQQQNNANNHWFCQFQETVVNDLSGAVHNIHMRTPKTAAYRIRVKGMLFGEGVQGSEQPQETKIYLGRNAAALASNNIPAYLVLGDNLPYGQEFEITSEVFALEENDTLCVIATRNTLGGPYTGGGSYSINTNNNANVLEVELIETEPNLVDFTTAFADFPIRDFLAEVTRRFGLTLFKDKYSSKYVFLTLQEVFQAPVTANWSKKFIKKIKESYLYGSYAQRNYFRYKYNDPEESHKDHYIDIANVNLDDSKTTVQSKIYAPERYPVTFMNAPGNVYKSFEKEVKEAPADEEGAEDTIEYKPLDKRYYFIKAQQQQGTLKLYSNDLTQHLTVSGCYRESYYGLSFEEIIANYYQPIQQVLNRSVVVTAEFWLNEADIANFDFKKLYYIEQLSGYFLMNKILNYIPGRPVKCEMVHVHYMPPQESLPSITLLSVERTGLTATLFFATVNLNTPYLAAQFSADGEVWTGNTGSPQSPRTVTVPAPGSYQFRLYHEGSGTYSNIITKLL